MLDIVPLVEDDSLRSTETGCEVRLRLKWYRSLPLSCIELLQVTLDDQPVNPDLIRLSVNGHTYQLKELTDLVEEFWFVQDAAILSIQHAGIVKRGESHKIGAELALRFPYIPIGPGKFLTHIRNYSAVQVAS